MLQCLLLHLQVKYRVEWTKHEERIKQREKAAIEKERAMYAQIDWHDFVVVETVDFMPDERGECPAIVSLRLDKRASNMLPCQIVSCNSFLCWQFTMFNHSHLIYFI